MKKAVLFDFHNTLALCDAWLELEIKTLPSLSIEQLVLRGTLPGTAHTRLDEAVDRFKALRQEVRVSGIEMSAVEGTRRVLVGMGYSLPIEVIDSVVAALERALLPQVEMVDGADLSLGRLRDDGFRLGVVSSAGYPQFVEMALEQLGLCTFFSVVVTSAGEGIYKSDPEIFRRAVRYLDAEPHESVHVGDHPIYDVQTAKAAGLSAVWYSAHSARTAHMHSTPWEETVRAVEDADAVISDLRDLPDVVARL